MGDPPPAPTSPRRATAESPRRRRVFIVLAPLLMWGALELVAWMVLRATPPPAAREHEWLVNARSAMESSFFRPDPHALWVLAPNYRQDPEGDGIYGQVPLEVNEFGHRSPAVTAQKPSGVRRILILGGSHPFGMWVGTDEVYSAVLERRLNEAGPHRWEVLNAACPGHTTFQGRQYLAHHGWQFQPDVVLFDLGVNDDLPLSLEYAAPDHEVGAVPLCASVATERAGASNVYRLLRRTLADAPGVGQRGGTRVPLAERLKNLAAVQEDARAHGARLLFASQVSVLNFRGPGRARCNFDPADHGFTPEIDVCALFEDRGDAAGTEFVDPVHATAAGHRRIGDAVFTRLGELGWLD